MPRLSTTALIAFNLSAFLQAGETDFILRVFESNCVQCHGLEGKVKGDLNLMEIRSASDLSRDPELLRSIVDVIDFEEMPPEDEPQLAPDERAKFLKDLQALLQQSLEGGKDYPHSPIRRMNRSQYSNAVTDLFKLECTVFALPERMMREHDGYFNPAGKKMPDSVQVGSRPLGKSQLIERRLAGVAAFPQDLRAEHGFDNRGDHLSLSPLLMESFLKLGQSITESPDFNKQNVGIWEEFFMPPTRLEATENGTGSRLESFLTRAFRRPVGEAELNRYSTFLSHRLDSGISYTEAIKEVSAAVISSPRFLYLYDVGNQEADNDSINDFELASRLSFFLWGSLPDQTLLDLASTGTLSDREVLVSEVERMLADRKLKRFCDSFPTQWLQLERIISSTPNPGKFPQFYFSQFRNSMHMMLEPLLLFETVLIENRPITQLIDPDFTYLTGRLQNAYGELGAPVDGNRLVGGGPEILTFNRVPITDRRTGGVITNAAVMTMTSGPERTQPITRGAWIATVIFNKPPDPPPADVPALDEKPPATEQNLTLRERLSMHRERADCLGCHEQIDPLGFALENYDSIGQWREVYENGREIEVADSLFRKHRFTSVVEFKDAILAEKDRFARGLAGHLLSYALARELGAADQPALDQITRRTAADDYRIQTLIREVILSAPFHGKTIPENSPNEPSSIHLKP